MFENFEISKYLMKSPPSNNSFDTLQEIKELNRIPINKNFVKEKDNIESNFKKIVGDDELIPELINASVEPLLKIKHHFNRPRPREIAPKLGIEMDSEYMPSMDTPSYPSGHSAQAVLIASVLSDKYPNKKEKLQKLAKDTSYSRNVAHEHYKSDSTFGWEIGMDMYEHVKNNIT